MQWASSAVKNIRVKKEDSVFVYWVLEAHEGVVSYSTLPHVQGDAHRDLELRYSDSMKEELGRLIESLGDLVYELDRPQHSS